MGSSRYEKKQAATASTATSLYATEKWQVNRIEDGCG